MCQSGVDIIITASGVLLSEVLFNSYYFSACLHFLSYHTESTRPFRASQALQGEGKPVHQQENSVLRHPQGDNRTLGPRCWPISFSQNGPEAGGRQGACTLPSQGALQQAAIMENVISCHWKPAQFSKT